MEYQTKTHNATQFEEAYRCPKDPNFQLAISLKKKLFRPFYRHQCCAVCWQLASKEFSVFLLKFILCIPINLGKQHQRRLLTKVQKSNKKNLENLPTTEEFTPDSKFPLFVAIQIFFYKKTTFVRERMSRKIKSRQASKLYQIKLPALNPQTHRAG